MKHLIINRKIESCYQCHYCIEDFGDFLCIHLEGVNKEIEYIDDYQKLENIQTIPDNCPLPDVEE